MAHPVNIAVPPFLSMRYIPEQSLHNRWDLKISAGGQKTDGKALKSQHSLDKANLGALGPSTRRKRSTFTELEALTFWDNLANLTFPRSVLRKSAWCYHAFKSGWEVHTEIFDPFWLLRISTWVPSLSEHWQIMGGGIAAFKTEYQSNLLLEYGLYKIWGLF